MAVNISTHCTEWNVVQNLTNEKSTLVQLIVWCCQENDNWYLVHGWSLSGWIDKTATWSFPTFESNFKWSWVNDTQRICSYTVAEHENSLMKNIIFFIFNSCQLNDSCNLNPLRAKFFRENINICLHFLPFLHTNKTQVVEIPPRVRQGPAYSL